MTIAAVHTRRRALCALVEVHASAASFGCTDVNVTFDLSVKIYFVYE